MTGSPRDDCFDKAIDLLARRPHFRRELASKLLQRGFAADEVDSALDRAESRGLLDDRQNALNLAAGSMSRKGFGPRRMRATLEAKGVDSDIALAVVGEVYPSRDSELEAARMAVERWRFSRHEERRKVGRHLERKGYSTSVVLQVLEELDRQG